MSEPLESIGPLTPQAEAVLRADVAALEAAGRFYAGRYDIISLLATLDAERAAGVTLAPQLDETCRSEGCQLRAGTIAYLAANPLAPTPPDALDVERLARALPSAVLGTTDTGGVYWRNMAVALRAALAATEGE